MRSVSSFATQGTKKARRATVIMVCFAHGISVAHVRFNGLDLQNHPLGVRAGGMG